MRGRQFAIGFAIAILLPLLLYYGTSTFDPPPKRGDYVKVQPFQPNLTPEERQARLQEQQEQQQSFTTAQGKFARVLFYVSVPVGYAALLAGGFMAVSAVGTGLIFGGMLTVISGHLTYWSFIENWQRFVSLIIAGAIIMIIASRKIAPERSKPDNPRSD